MVFHENPEYNQLIKKIVQYYDIAQADEIDQLNALLRTMVQRDHDAKGELICRYHDTYRLFIERSFDELMEDLQSLLEDFKALNMTYYIMKTYNSLAIIKSEYADYYESLGYYLNAYRIAQEHPDFCFTSILLNNIGNLFVWLGEFEPAIPYMLEAYHTYYRENVEDVELIATIVVNIIEAYSCLDQFEEADKWFHVKIEYRKDEQIVLDNFRLSNEFIKHQSDYDEDQKAALLQEIFHNLKTSDEYIYQFKIALRILEVCIQTKRQQDCITLMNLMDMKNKDMRNMETFLYDYSVLKVQYCLAFNKDKEQNEVFIEYYERSRKVLQQLRNTYTNSLTIHLTLVQTQQEKQDVESLNSELQRSIKIDNFTKLYNKTALIQSVDSSIRTNKNKVDQAMIIVDIDNFKDVNDQYGHQVGDNVLLKVADVLKNVHNEKIEVGRFGGDEFIIFMKENTSVHDVDEFVKELLVSGREILIVDEAMAHITLSIGVAYGREKSFEDYFVKADEALYESKKQGRDRYTLFSQ